MEKELTFKKFFELLSKRLRYLTIKWPYIALVGLIFAGVFYIYAKTKTVTYHAELSFSMNSSQTQSGSAGLILGSLGLGGGGGVGSNPDRLLILAKSRQVVDSVLLDHIVVETDSMLFANYLIDVYGFHDRWKDSELISGYKFPSNVDLNDSATLSALKSLSRFLVDDEIGLVDIRYNFNSLVFFIKVNSIDQDASLFLVNKLYERIADCYIDLNIAGKRQTVDKLTVRQDSLNALLRNIESKLAYEEDRLNNIYKNSNLLQVKRLRREALVVQTVLGEVIKNRESAAFVLDNQMPVFLLIDIPMLPLDKHKVSAMRNLVVGGLVGVILISTLLLVNLSIKEALK